MENVWKTEEFKSTKLNSNYYKFGTDVVPTKLLCIVLGIILRRKNGNDSKVQMEKRKNVV